MAPFGHTPNSSNAKHTNADRNKRPNGRNNNTNMLQSIFGQVIYKMCVCTRGSVLRLRVPPFVRPETQSISNRAYRLILTSLNVYIYCARGTDNKSVDCEAMRWPLTKYIRLMHVRCSCKEAGRVRGKETIIAFWRGGSGRQFTEWRAHRAHVFSVTQNVADEK